MSLRIIFFGTPAFALPCLKTILESGYEIVAVVSAPDKPAGRKGLLTPPPVKSWLGEQKHLEIAILQPEKLDSQLAAEIRELGPELGIIAGYGKIIPKEILEIPQKGFLNVHPSLLPRWRGPAPIQHTLLAGDEKTGVTIHVACEKADAGGIVAQKEIEISEADTYLSLEKKLSELGAKLLGEILPDFLQGKIIPAPQDESQATYAKMIKTEDGRIDWSRPAEEVSRQIRALNPEPGIFTFWEGRRLLLLEALTETMPHQFEPGFVLKEGDSFKIAARDGFIKPLRITLEGRKETTPAEFLKGRPRLLGSILA